MTTTLHLGIFSPSVVSAVAHEHGFYAAEGLAVEEHPVTSSPQQFTSLTDGDYDVVLTAPDNVATYRFNVGNPLGRRLDVRMLAGVDAGTGLSLVARPGLTRVEDLRGRRVAVDVPGSGFALVLFALLARAGLGRDDVEIVAAGSTPRRFAGLGAGDFDATMLNAGFDVRAEADGHVRLARVAEVADPYLGTVVATTGTVADSRGAVIEAFLRAWAAATAYVLDDAHRSDVEDVVAGLLSLSAQDAAVFYDVLRDPRTGLVPDGALRHEALSAVLELRAGQGGFAPDRPIEELVADGLVDQRFTART